MATVETPLITYNLADRGRQYRGKERHFHLQRMADAINAPETQERVKHRDMLGFYGHWPRIRFGMNPCEGSPSGAVEPALVTTHLSAKPDGTVQHRAEFLATKPGTIAAQLFQSRTGGFSSAIDESRPEFFGFDFVLEPNYSTNRGYELTLDAVTGNFAISGMTLDAIMAADYNDQLDAALILLHKMEQAQSFVLDSLSRLQRENEELISMLARKQVTLDDTKEASSPLTINKSPADRIIRDIEGFHAARLPPLAQEGKSSFTETALYKRLRRL